MSAITLLLIGASVYNKTNVETSVLLFSLFWIKKNLETHFEENSAMWVPGFDSWVGKIPWRRERLTHSSILAWRIPWSV